MYPDPNGGPLWEIPKTTPYKKCLFMGSYMYIYIYNPQEPIRELHNNYQGATLLGKPPVLVPGYLSMPPFSGKGISFEWKIPRCLQRLRYLSLLGSPKAVLSNEKGAPYMGGVDISYAVIQGLQYGIVRTPKKKNRQCNGK